MLFLELNEICEWCEQNGLSVGEHFDISFPKFKHIKSVPIEENGRPSNSDVASSLCIQFFGEWDEILVLVTEWGVWASSEDWPDYYKFRGDRGEKRSLGKAPGHLFQPHETEDLYELLVKIMKFGWDTHILCLKDKRLDRMGAFTSNNGFLDLLSSDPINII